MPRTVIGCDLSRAVVDLHTLPDATSAQLPNEPEAIAAWASSLASGILVVFEATSGCEARLRRGVDDGEIPADVDVHALARFVQSVQNGMSVLARDGVTRAELESIAEIAMMGWDARVGD